MRAQVPEFEIDERARRGADQDLPAMASGGDARGTMDVQADIPLIRRLRLAGMKTHPDAERPIIERILRFAGGGQRLPRRGEGNEESVSFRIDLNPLVTGENLAQHPPMIG